MATATAYYSVNMDTARVWYGDVTIANSRQIQINSGGYTQNYFGSNFTFNNYTVIGGTVTSTDYYEFGTKFYSISNASLSAVTVARYIDYGDMQGVLAYTFSGNDQFQGSFQSDALNGFEGDDVIYGNGGDDLLKGGNGNDTLAGNAGNDILDGGNGADTAVYAGNRSSYVVSTAAGGYTVSGGAEGTDTLTSVEYLKFTDQTVAVDSLVGHGGSSGNDTLTGGAGIPLDGGTGTDTVVYSSNKGNYSITYNSNGTWTVGSDTLRNVERIQFSDAKIALDIAGNPNACFDTAGLANAGQVYRIYQAAFNRTPDVGGLANWITHADNQMSLTTIAGYFATSAEFVGTYGSLPDHQFVDQIYQNVLHRSGEIAGLSYWYGQLDSGAMSRAQVLVGFSDSNENQSAVIGVIQNGINYTT